VIPVAEQLAQRKYCKWHDSFSHTTNECNYFHQQIQSALNHGHLTLGDTQEMKLDVNPFPVDLIDFGEKKVLVRSDKAKTMTGKNVVVSDDLRVRMMKLRQPEVGVWKRNIWRKNRPEWRLTSSFLMEKYTRERHRSMFGRLGGCKWRRLPGGECVMDGLHAEPCKRRP
jgi:hypothetical protein